MRCKPYQPPYTIPEILLMRSQGKTYSEIGNHFGISSSRIGHVVKREEQRQQSAERTAVILNEIRSQNDIDRKLTIPDLLCVLNLTRRAEAVLKRYFNAEGILEFSLRDMMDFLLPVVEGAAEFIDYMPAFRVKTMGTICYSDIVKGLSALNGGEMFQREWVARKKQLREYCIRMGSTLHRTRRWADALA